MDEGGEPHTTDRKRNMIIGDSGDRVLERVRRHRSRPGRRRLA